MASGTTSVTRSLTPSQEEAREFWRQAGADSMPPFYVMSQYYAQLSANSDNLLAVTAALEQLLTGLGYETDVDTVFTEFDPGQKEELGYWTGHYCLFDNDGNRFDLVVGRNGATLTVPPALVDVTKLPAGADLASVTVLSDANFSDGVLQLKNAQFQASLSFALPVKEEDFDDPSHPAAAMFRSTAPRCQGSFGIVGGEAVAARPVNGKRGAWTRAGVAQTADGDPVSPWYGQYVLLDVTEVIAVVQAGGADAATASVVQVPDPVYIYNDPQSGQTTFQWGDGDHARYGGTVTYNNNVLQCPEEGDENTHYAMQFTAPQAGAAELSLAVTKAGVVRSYKGYWVGRYPPPRPASQARLATRPMTATYSAGSNTSAAGYSQVIDVSTLTAGGSTKINLPDGAVGNTYALTLNMTNCAATDKFSWAVTKDPTGRAAITLTGQTAQLGLDNLSDSDGQRLQVTVQLTRTSPAPSVTYTLLLVIAVIRCDAITIEPAVPPPVVVGTPYTQQLTAYGAQDHFTWSDPTKHPDTSLPPGLTWDNNSHQLSGTVTDASQFGKAFNLVLELAASDVIMGPLTASLPITVQSGPAVASSSMPVWEIRLIMLGSALVLGGLINIALRRLLAGRGNTMTTQAIESGWTNIENAIGEDPRSASQSILRNDNDTLPIIITNNAPLQSEISDIIQKQKALTNSIDETQKIIYRLDDYLSDHRDDDPEDPVEDRYIRDDLNYHTFREAEAGLVDHMSLHLRRGNELRDSMGYGNALQARIASHQNRIDESSRSKSNDARLLGSE